MSRKVLLLDWRRLQSELKIIFQDGDMFSECFVLCCLSITQMNIALINVEIILLLTLELARSD